MMRARMVSLMLIASLGMALAGGGSAGAAGAVKGAPVGAWRTSLLRASPAPDDLALIQIRFRGTVGRRRLWRATVRASLVGPVGADYVALATPAGGVSRSPRALVLIVNRPSALLDPTSVRLRLRTLRGLGSVLSSKVLDPFTHHVGGTPALCGMSLHGSSTLGASALRTLRAYGAGLSGFDPAAAIAEAYDVACGLPYEASFEQAVRQGGAGACRPVGELCCPVTAICATPPGTPTPAPPSPGPPGCTPCNPRPGYACPLAVPSICVAPAGYGSRRSPAGSH